MPGLVARPYQTKAIEDIRAAFAAGARRVVFVLPTGGGKCLAIGTPVIMADGTVRPVEKIQPGDFVMGPDSLPRKVLQTTSGAADLFEVRPKKGAPYVVTGNHILSLRTTNGIKGVGRWVDNQIVNVSVLDYLAMNKTQKHVLKGWRAPAISFVASRAATPLRLPPYLFGCWLGDGSSAGPSITTMDAEIVREIFDAAAKFGLSVRKETLPDNRAATYYLTSLKDGAFGGAPGRNPVLNALRKMGVLNNKHIPAEYLTASLEDRAELLAGIIDTDGHYDKKQFSITQKSHAMILGIEFLARSMGLACHARAIKKTCVNNGAVGDYWILNISGDLDRVPTRLSRKQAEPRRIKKNHLNVGISVAPIGMGEYAGFECDGDHLFLLGDFTVTHNSAVASMIGAGLHRNNKKALYLGHRIEIVEQLGAAVKGAGVPCAYLVAGSYGMPVSNIIVGSIGTVNSRKERFAWQPDLIFVDESHHANAKTWKDVLEHFPNAKVVGLTATPCRLDGRGLGEIFDSMVEGPHTDELIRDGYLCDFEVYAPSTPDLTGLHVRGGDYVNKELEEAMRKAAITGDAVKHYRKLAHNKSAVVFCVSIAHAEEVAQKFRDAGYDFRSIDGKMQSGQRRQLIDMMTKGKIHGLTSCDIISEGTDIPRIEAAILLRPTKSLGLYKQQVGRGLRPFPGKDKLIVLDHAGNTHVHGLPDTRIEWSLSGGARRGGAGDKIGATKTCHKCFAVHRPAPVCPRCGAVYEVKSRKIEYREGELQKIDKIAGVDGTGKPKSYWDQARASLQAVAEAKGYKKGWVDHVLAARQEAERKKIADEISGGFKSG